MTVADNTSRNQYTATSGQTVFAYTFEIVDKSHIVVLKNGTTLSEGTDYTVSNVGNDNGGNVTLTSGATAGDILTLYRDMPYSRTQNYTNSGDFLASEVNADFDDLWLAGEQTNRSFSQSIRKPITDSDSISMELPDAATRKNSFLRFDATGAVALTAAGDPAAPSSMIRQQFTGDGTTTVFTLASDPGALGESVQVFIDGIYQEDDTYSISGTSLTFTEAPPTNASIETIAFRVNEIGTTSANLVTYTPAGTGAVDTTVQTKLRESVSVKDFGATGDGVTDDTAAIQAALDTGKDVIGTGSFKVTAPISISTADQELKIDGAIYPYHDGDCIRITGARVKAKVRIVGGTSGGPYNQPRTGSVGGAFVVGYGGANAQNVSLQDSSVSVFYGDGVTYEQGSMLDCTNVTIFECSRDGIRFTTNHNDNNHGYMANTHVISCSGVGFNILNAGAVDDNDNPRHTVFSNAKAFGCNKNFFIGTINNIGSVFSENGVTNDEFGTNSRGNYIQVIETATAYGSWTDNGGNNTLQGYNSYRQFSFKNIFLTKGTINSQFEGNRELYQSGTRAFQDDFSNTSGAVTVTRARGTASKRTDVFSDRIQFAGSTNPLVINSSRMGTVTNTPGTITAGGTYRFAIASATTGAGTGDSVSVSVSAMNQYTDLGVNAYIHAGGDVVVTLVNHSTGSITLPALTYRWVITKHFT